MRLYARSVESDQSAVRRHRVSSAVSSIASSIARVRPTRSCMRPRMPSTSSRSVTASSASAAVSSPAAPAPSAPASAQARMAARSPALACARVGREGCVRQARTRNRTRMTHLGVARARRRKRSAACRRLRPRLGRQASLGRRECRVCCRHRLVQRLGQREEKAGDTKERCRQQRCQRERVCGGGGAPPPPPHTSGATARGVARIARSASLAGRTRGAERRLTQHHSTIPTLIPRCCHVVSAD